MTADKPALTAGQVAVLRLAATGHKIRETARLLDITEDAVKSRCRAAARALGTNNTTHTVAVAQRLGLLEEESPVPDTDQRDEPAREEA